MSLPLPPLKVPALFVTGTDTGVGKTKVSCAILRLLKQAAHQPLALKPMVSGIGEKGTWEDAELLAAETGQAPEQVAPIRFELPMAPAMAAEQEGKAVDWAALARQVEWLNQQGRPVVIEGAGGLMVPLDPKGILQTDLMVHFAKPMLVVARAGLGTLNHSSLTLQCLKQLGLSVLGVVFNHLPVCQTDNSARHNATWLERMHPEVSVLGEVPTGDSVADVIDRAAQTLADIPWQDQLA